MNIIYRDFSRRKVLGLAALAALPMTPASARQEPDFDPFIELCDRCEAHFLACPNDEDGQAEWGKELARLDTAIAATKPVTIRGAIRGLEHLSFEVANWTNDPNDATVLDNCIACLRNHMS